MSGSSEGSCPQRISKGKTYMIGLNKHSLKLMRVGTRKTSLARTAYFVPVIAAFFSHEYISLFTPNLPS